MAGSVGYRLVQVGLGTSSAVDSSVIEVVLTYLNGGAILFLTTLTLVPLARSSARSRYDSHLVRVRFALPEIPRGYGRVPPPAPGCIGEKPEQSARSGHRPGWQPRVRTRARVDAET